MPTLNSQLRRRSTLRGVRSLEICVGAVRGIGEKHYPIPVETSVEVGEGRVIVESRRSEKGLGGIGFVVN